MACLRVAPSPGFAGYSPDFAGERLPPPPASPGTPPTTYPTKQASRGPRLCGGECARLVANTQRGVEAPHGQRAVIDLRPELSLLGPRLRRPKPQPAVLVDRAVQRFAQLPGVGVPTQQEAERRNAPTHTEPHLVCLLGAALRPACLRRSPVH